MTVLTDSNSTTAHIDTEYNFEELPYLSPQQIIEMRAEYTSAQHWYTYVSQNYPDINAEEQKQIKLEENRQKNRLTCGDIWMGKWHPQDIKHKMRVTFCKQRGCPVCDARRLYGASSRLDNLDGNSVITIEPGQEDEFKKDLSKSEYVRIPRKDGKITFILKEEHPDGQPLTEEIKNLLAQDIVGVKGQRITGNLGKIVVVKEEEEPLTPEEIMAEEYQMAEQDTVEVQNHQITFSPDSTLKSMRQIDNEVYRRLGFTELAHNVKMLQWLMSELERLTEIVCKENMIEYRRLSIETVSVDIGNVAWEDFEKRLKKAQK